MVPGLPYRRTQQVPPLFTITGFALTLLFVLLMFQGLGTGPTPLWLLLAMTGGPALLLVYVLIAFRELTVEVREGEVRLAFGALGPRKRIDLARVIAVRPVRTSWLRGWGIRWIVRGWMWNLWGLDAVELEFGHRKIFRVGTDRPGELATAIEMARRARAKQVARESARS